MNLFSWNKGRQNTGYEAFPVLITKILDFYVLRYKTGTSIPEHVDPISDRRHYRLNVILNTVDGGDFNCEKMIYNSKRIKLFRPDLYKHSVSTVKSGTRYVLSFGLSMKV